MRSDARPHGLRLRLLGAMLAVFVLGLAASLASYRFAFHNIVRDLRERTLQAQARALEGAMRPLPGGRLEVALPADWQAVYADPSRNFAYAIYDLSRRQPIAWSANLGAAPPFPELGASTHRGMDRIELVGAGDSERAVLATRTPGGLLLVISRGDLSHDTLIDSLLEESSEHLAVLVPFALCALALIWIVSGWSLRPVDRASREAALVGPDKPEVRIPVEGLPREIRPLVDAVNGALDRLSRAYATERRLTSDAAHELRTPLAVLGLRLQRARLTGTIDWGAIERELGEMRRLVDQLLDLARKESLAHELQGASRTLVNLSRVVREVAASLVPLAESSGRRLDIELPDAAPVRGRVEDLRDLVRNLLDNALIHGHGTVSVRIRQAPERAGLVLEVADEGDGVPPGREEAVFERFCKLDAAAPGSGLGLAIVRQVARSHGGEVRFVPGRGCVRLTLPAVASGMPDGAESDAHPHRGEARAQPIAARPLRPDEEALP